MTSSAHQIQNQEAQNQPNASNFLLELEKENEILEKELALLLNRQTIIDSSNAEMDMARFSFSNPTQSFKTNSDLVQEHGYHDSLELDQPYQFKLEPHQLDENKNRDNSCSTQSITKGLELKELQSYDQSLDNLMGSINNIVQDKRIQRRFSSDSKKIGTNGAQLEDSARSSQKDKQIKSLEMRLSGTREALKSTERELKEKNRVILQMQQELVKKNKLIEQNNNYKENYDHSNRNQLSETLGEVKKREKALQQKVQEYEGIQRENKKYMLRLQELNSNLLTRVKQADESNQLNELQQQENKYLEIIEDYKNKHSIARRDKDDLQKKYDKLKQSSDEYLEKTANLKDKYTWLLQKIEELSQ